MSRLVLCPLRWRLAILAMVAAVSPLGAMQASGAPQSLKESSSLAIVPDDVAFYAAGMRWGEIFDQVMASNAVAELRAIPAMQFALSWVDAQWQNPQNPAVAAIKQQLQDPQNQQLLALLRDVVSHEVFVYGGAGFGEALDLLNAVNAASSAGQLEAMAAGDFEEAGSYQAKRILEVLDQKGDQLKVPAVVVGMKLSAVEPAKAQLARLEKAAAELSSAQPMLQGRFARETIGDAEFLTLRLDGSLIPWPLLVQSGDAEQMQPIIDKLAALKLVLSLGVRGDYLIVSIGEDNQHLAALGAGQLLYDRAELAPLRAAADKPMVSIGYVSAAFAQQVASIETQLDQMAAMAKQLLPLAGLGPDLQDELTADIDKLSDYIKTHAPEPGALSGFTFQAAGGFESFSYQWSADSPFDASQPLTILSHVGGDPIAFWAARGKSDPEHVDALATAVRRAAYYLEQFALQQLDDAQQGVYERLRDEFQPLIERIGSVTREKLVPAFEDGQSALVLDAQSTSESWHAMLPPADEALPMLELGLVMGVRDAGLVKEAFSEYFEIVQAGLDKLHELSAGEMSDVFPNEIPAMELARPQAKQLDGGTVYYYAIPAEAGLDQQIAPNAGLSDQVMAVSLLPRFTARLLAEKPLPSRGPLANLDRPLAAAGQLEFSRLLAALAPWIDYGLQLGLGSPGQAGGEGPGTIAQQVHDVLDVLQCFRGVCSATYREGDAMVTHSQWRFEDLQ